MNDLTFSLGLSAPAWLKRPGLFAPETPLFYSFNTLVQVKELGPAEYDIRGDSGNFTQKQLHGPHDPYPNETFVPEVRRICTQLGRVKAFAIKDWMCEPQVIHGLVRPLKPGRRRRGPEPRAWLEWAREAGPALAETVRAAEALGAGRFEVVFHGTGLPVEEHQRRTVQSYLDLMRLAPDVPWFPVLQGWEHDDYLRCWDMYRSEGVRLEELPIVGVGSTCRRHDTAMVEGLARELHGKGLRNLWMLGMKSDGLRRCARYVRWADSHAWSYGAEYEHIIVPGCQHGEPMFRKRLGRVEYGNCANCPRLARRWYEEQLAIIRQALGRQPIARRGPMQLPLFQGAA